MRARAAQWCDDDAAYRTMNRALGIIYYYYYKSFFFFFFSYNFINSNTILLWSTRIPAAFHCLRNLRAVAIRQSIAMMIIIITLARPLRCLRLRIGPRGATEHNTSLLLLSPVARDVDTGNAATEHRRSGSSCICGGCNSSADETRLLL